jgi:hypothetical protein
MPYSQDIPGYSEYPSSVTPKVVPDSSYWGGDTTFLNPSWVDRTKYPFTSNFQQPSIWDALKEGLYRGLTGGMSGGLGSDAYGRNPFSPYTPEAGGRMAGSDERVFGAMPDYLRYDVQRLLNPKLEVRPSSIYSGYLR